MAKKSENNFRELIDSFIESDIPVAEVIDDSTSTSPYRFNTVAQAINRMAARMGYGDIIKARSAKGKPYIINLTLVEEA